MRQGLNKQGKRNGNHSFRKGQGRHYCVCSHCAYSVEHKPGLPCRNLICPSCGLPLARTDAESTITSSKQSLQGCEKSANLQANTSNESKKEQANSAIIKTKTKRLPVVDITKCTGCGICVDTCRRGAISLKNGIAMISSDLCVNCGLCIKKCPQGALS